MTTLNKFHLDGERNEWVVFNNKFYVLSDQLVNLKPNEKGIQVYSSPWKNAIGKLIYINNQFQIISYDTHKEIAYGIVNPSAIDYIKQNYKAVDTWTF